MSCRLTIIRLNVLLWLFAVLTMVHMPFVRANLALVVASVVFIVAPLLEAGITQLTKWTASRSKCCLTEENSMDVAIQGVGQLLDVGEIVGVTYDMPEDGPRGKYHLHVSMLLIRADDSAL